LAIWDVVDARPVWIGLRDGAAGLRELVSCVWAGMATRLGVLVGLGNGPISGTDWPVGWTDW
jgi:hypothetical protein